jgi:hypothetical protein
MNKFLRTKVYLLIKKIINIYLFIYL